MPAGFPPGRPGMGDEIEMATQQAPQPALQADESIRGPLMAQDPLPWEAMKSRYQRALALGTRFWVG